MLEVWVLSEVGLVETKSGFETDRLSGCFEAAPITSSCTSACTASGSASAGSCTVRVGFLSNLSKKLYITQAGLLLLIALASLISELSGRFGGRSLLSGRFRQTDEFHSFPPFASTCAQKHWRKSPRE